MIIQVINEITVLSPADGYKSITNGETWTTEAWLGKLDSANNWHDTNDDPPEDPIEEVE